MNYRSAIRPEGAYLVAITGAACESALAHSTVVLMGAAETFAVSTRTKGSQKPTNGTDKVINKISKLSLFVRWIALGVDINLRAASQDLGATLLRDIERLGRITAARHSSYSHCKGKKSNSGETHFDNEALERVGGINGD